ncbi:MAG: glycoside hydrolase family 88 protein [Cyclobacteriaceae bacterium]
MTKYLFAGLFAISIIGCQPRKTLVSPETKQIFDVDQQLDYCAAQVEKTLAQVPESGTIPRNVLNGKKDWTMVDYKDWTSGFWPGVLWYVYEYTGEDKWLNEADRFTEYLKPLSVQPAYDHDLGFQVFNSAGNGYRLTQQNKYKDMVLKTADTLATLFNPTVGTILSWPRKSEYPHNTIIDNLMNLELLTWSANNGGTKSLYNVAMAHADTTMDNHFREDYSAYHVLVYDTITGNKLRGVTHQGYADETMWARGQAWAIYGYTMMYRETSEKKYLDFAHKITKIYLDRLPKDLIPYWDFDHPDIPNIPRDASAAAIVSSALFELAGYTTDSDVKQNYIDQATAMITELSNNYQSRDENSAFLKHCTGHHPGGTEIDASIIYADYYYIEALLRYKKLQDGIPVVNSVLANS